MEGAFFCFKEQVIFSESLEDLRNMLAMFGLTPGVYKNVIDVDENELMEKLPEYLVHKILEYGGGVG